MDRRFTWNNLLKLFVNGIEKMSFGRKVLNAFVIYKLIIRDEPRIYLSQTEITKYNYLCDVNVNIQQGATRNEP